MAVSGLKAEKQLKEITQCPICMSAFTDPRILPCIHTFCLDCLAHTSEAAQKQPGDKMPCPLCRKEFIIPEDGMNGVQKNFFMKNFLEFKNALQLGSSTIICDICNLRNEDNTGNIPKATMTCMGCQDYYCDSCAKDHQFGKVSKDHKMMKIGADAKLGRKRLVSVKSCPKHSQKPLDYYCGDCKKIVCVSCFVESHASHKCKDVTTADKEFRQMIEKKATKISVYVNDMQVMRNSNEKRKKDFLKEIVEKENEILKINQELKEMIDRHTNSLLNELSVIKSNHLKEMETGLEEIDRYCAIFTSFEAYCTQLASKGSASDICSSVDELVARADDLETDLEAFTGRPHKSFEVSFKATDLGDVLQNANNNFVGNVEGTTSQYENIVFVVGLSDGATTTEDVVEINLHWPNEVSAQEQFPTTMAREAVAAVYCNTMYVAGIGVNEDQIWKYNQTSGWVECASLGQGRRRHSAAFVDEVLYICGGFVEPSELVLDSVEAFNAVANACTTVGKLVHAVESTGNCVPYRNSLYIFGGLDKDDNEVSHVQLYNTRENICTLMTRPMPRSYWLMRAVLWETSVVLLGWDTCFIFNIETGTWQERKQFKTDVVHFGLVLENERLFVIGGGNWEKDAWNCRDAIRYVPIQNIIVDTPIDWKIHGKLPKPTRVHACASMQCFVIDDDDDDDDDEEEEEKEEEEEEEEEEGENNDEADDDNVLDDDDDDDDDDEENHG